MKTGTTPYENYPKTPPGLDCFPRLTTQRVSPALKTKWEVHPSPQQRKEPTKRYSDLPRRYVSGDNGRKPCVSYGAIVQARNTGRWCLVQRTFSPEYIELIRGTYDHVRMSEYKTGLSRSECEKFKEMLRVPIEQRRQEFEKWYRQVVMDNLVHEGYLKFTDCHEMLCSEFDDFEAYYEETEWLWPKGRSNHNESQKDAATREFFEETGIRTGKLKAASQITPVESYQAMNRVTYQSKCWVFTVEEELELGTYPSSNYPTEIMDSRWMTYEEAYRRLRATKKPTLVQATNLIEARDTRRE